MTSNIFSSKAESLDNDHHDVTGKRFTLDLKGFEGPLHLLLNLSRSQKVDLRKISLVDLCDQYLDFISEAKKLRIEIAADYLIMAAWLVYLKSELILPKDQLNGDDNAEELAQNLKLQLLRLDAMRNAAIQLMSSDQLDRDFFRRGKEDIIKNSKNIVYSASLLEVLQAYAQLKAKDDFKPLHIKQSFILTPEQALETINKMLKLSVDWQLLENFVPEAWKKTSRRTRTATATNFSVFLELARLQKVELMQSELFAPLYLRSIEES
jgi:segregation and condensation protein A